MNPDSVSRRSNIGIVAALSIEIGPFLDRLTGLRKISGRRSAVYEGELADRRVCVILSGPGRPNARAATRLLIDGHRPSWIISAGFAGGLDPSLKRNEIVAVAEVRDEAGASCELEASHRLGLPTARLLTVDRIIATAREKSALKFKHNVDLVDMETIGTAEVCAERSTRMAGVRVISDEAGVDLPSEVNAILGSSGAYRIGAALGAIVRRPSSIKDLWGLREVAIEAADRLDQTLDSLIRNGVFD